LETLDAMLLPSPTFEVLVLVLHLVVTGYMTGLIWFVQLVHYPLMAHVGREKYVEYQNLHMRQTTWAVSPMLIELVCSGALFRFSEVSLTLKASGALLLAAVWLTTGLASVPAHTVLTRGFDSGAHRALVETNWIRTTGWSLRLLLAIWMLLSVLPAK